MSNIAPSAQSGTYPIADEVMQLARAIVNDMLRDVNGRILTNAAPFSVVYLNSAIRKVQRYFANNGLTNYLKDNVILPSMSAVATTDPSVQVFVSKDGYNDGVQLHASPALPVDLILPLAVWERTSGLGASFTPVLPANDDGLPSRVPGQTLDVYEWRNDALNFLGATSPTDLRIRYEASIPAIGAGANLTQIAIPLRDAHEALANWVAWYYGFARGSELRAEAKKNAEEEMDEVINRYVRKDERIAYRSGGFRAGGGPIDGALTGSTK
jgi:hypothetical protein